MFDYWRVLSIIFPWYSNWCSIDILSWSKRSRTFPYPLPIPMKISLSPMKNLIFNPFKLIVIYLPWNPYDSFPKKWWYPQLSIVICPQFRSPLRFEPFNPLRFWTWPGQAHGPNRRGRGHLRGVDPAHSKQRLRAGGAAALWGRQIINDDIVIIVISYMGYSDIVMI